MALDPRFVLLAPLQEQLIDKTTGAALSSGIVTFYEDENRSILKPVYQLSGSPPYSAASYVQLNNPIILTSIGTFADNNGNDIIPYLFPYQGTPTSSTGAVELYYIVVTDSNGGSQFTREAWPNTTTSSPAPEEVEVNNFVPNGQFLLHNQQSQITVTSTTARNVNTNVTYVAQGGWTFEIPSSSSGSNTYTVSFITNNSPSTAPDTTANPRYSINIVGNTVIANSFCDLCLEFPNVNKFASSITEYTYGFQAIANGNNVNVQLLVGYNYGTGGSPSTYTESASPITTWTVTTGASTAYSSDAIIFGTNSGKVLGSNNDDFIKLILRFPSGASSSFNITLTDFVLVQGDVLINTFPVTADATFIAPSTAGWPSIPVKSDGSDLYLPMVKTQQGVFYDSSIVGRIESEISVSEYTNSVSTISNKLLCDGSQYLTSGYSPLGIPYSRLQAKLFNSTQLIPIYGTGPNFVNAYINNGANTVARLDTNIAGNISSYLNFATANPTGFSAVTTHAGQTANGFTAFANSGQVFVRCNTLGFNNTASNAHTLGSTASWVLSDLKNGTDASHVENYTFVVSNITNAAGVANPGSAGLYFTFTNGPTSTNYYLWFQITNETDPAPGGTGIKIILKSTDTIQDVANQVAEAINGFQMATITFGAEGTIPANAFFTFNANNSTSYYVWYNKNSGGTDPAPGGFTRGIPVVIATGATAAQVASATISAINSTYFASPNFRGMYLRGYQNSDSRNLNPNAVNAFGFVSGINGDAMGTMQLDQIYAHVHPPSTGTGFLNTIASGGTTTTPGAGSTLVGSPTTGTVGGDEVRVVSAIVNYSIRY